MKRSNICKWLYELKTGKMEEREWIDIMEDKIEETIQELTDWLLMGWKQYSQKSDWLWTRWKQYSQYPKSVLRETLTEFLGFQKLDDVGSE